MTHRPKQIDGSDWQLEEYRRLMGAQALERQTQAALQAKGLCSCSSRVVKGKRGFLTVHELGCPRHQAWMDDYAEAPRNARAAGFVQSVRPSG